MSTIGRKLGTGGLSWHSFDMSQKPNRSGPPPAAPVKDAELAPKVLDIKRSLRKKLAVAS